MKLQSLHSHSLFDDGKSTMEEMVQGALAQGLSALGFSGHSPMPTPQDWTVQVEDLPRYRQEALRLEYHIKRLPRSRKEQALKEFPQCCPWILS